MQWRPRNVQNVLPVQSCCLAYQTYCFFDVLRSLPSSWSDFRVLNGYSEDAREAWSPQTSKQSYYSTIQYNKDPKNGQNTTTMSPLCKETLDAIPVLYTFIESVQLVKHFYILLWPVHFYIIFIKNTQEVRDLPAYNSCFSRVLKTRISECSYNLLPRWMVRLLFQHTQIPMCLPLQKALV